MLSHPVKSILLHPNLCKLTIISFHSSNERTYLILFLDLKHIGQKAKKQLSQARLQSLVSFKTAE